MRFRGLFWATESRPLERSPLGSRLTSHCHTTRRIPFTKISLDCCWNHCVTVVLVSAVQMHGHFAGTRLLPSATATLLNPQRLSNLHQQKRRPIPVAVWSRRRSAAARLLGLRVRIPLRAWMSVSCECCDHSFREVVPRARARVSNCV